MRFLRFCPKADISCIQAGPGLALWRKTSYNTDGKPFRIVERNKEKGGALVENSNGGVQSVARIFALIEVLCAHPKGASLQTISAERPAQKHGAPAALQPCIAGLRGAGQFLHALSADDEDVRAVQRHRQRYGYHVRCKAASGQAFPPYGRGGASGYQDGVDIAIYKAEAGAGLGGMRMSSHVGLRIPHVLHRRGQGHFGRRATARPNACGAKSSIRALTAHTITVSTHSSSSSSACAWRGYAIDDEGKRAGHPLCGAGGAGHERPCGGGVQHLGPCRADDGRPHRASGAYGPCRAAGYSARPRLEVDRGIQAQTGAAQNKIIINNRCRENTKKRKNTF